MTKTEADVMLYVIEHIDIRVSGRSIPVARRLAERGYLQETSGVRRPGRGVSFRATREGISAFNQAIGGIVVREGGGKNKKGYYRETVLGALPRFGGTIEEAYRFPSVQAAVAERNRWPFTASVGCVLEVVHGAKAA